MVFHPQKFKAVRCLVHTKEVMVTNYTNFTAKKKTESEFEGKVSFSNKQ